MSATTNEFAGERESYRRLLQITEGEVGRIILDIHDGPVQNIFAALSQLNLARRQLGRRQSDPVVGEQLERIDRSMRMLESALTEIRTFMGTFRPPEFERRDLVSVLEGLVIQHESNTGNPVELEADTSIPEVSLPVKIALYRILQEALSNAVRHGHADHHVVRLHSNGLNVLLEVADHGDGFDPEAVLAHDDGPGRRLGLSGMRERALLLGGTFTLRSNPGEGTQILVEVPCQ